MIDLPGIEIFSFSTSILFVRRFLATSELEIDPKSLPSGPTLTGIFNSNLDIFEANFSASSITDFSLKAFCLRFSAKTFFADSVARTALPVGIKKFLPYPALTETNSSLKPILATI